MIRFKHCHICNSEDIEEHLKTKDFFFSKEEFTLFKCNTCGFIFTNPVPNKENIGNYYKTEKYLSHNSKGENLISKLYNLAREINLKNKYQLLKLYKREAEVLDIGCGTGEFLWYLKKKKYKVLGVEPNENARKFASQNYKIKVLTEEKLSSLPNSYYDVITMWHALEHVFNPQKRLNLIYKLLKNDGIFINAIPMINSPDAIKHGKYWAGIDVPRHLHHFSANTFELLAKKCNFEIVERKPMILDSFYVSWLSRQAKNQKFPLIGGLYDGLNSNIKADKHKNYSSMIFILKKINHETE